MNPDHDAPPPPYSVTDIYSHSGGDPTPAASSTNGRHADDTISSSTGDIIYTPPLTPTTARSVAAEASPAVAAYFQSRPAPLNLPSERLEHTITINSGTRPQDLDLQPTFLARDVQEQDWRTFVNFLLPDHAARSNEAIVDRKLRAESDAGSARSGAEAQLGSIRSDDGNQSASAPRREDTERTVEEWNTFFFAPRGILIRLSSELEARQMPGAWDQAFDNDTGNTNNRATNNVAAEATENQRSWGMGGIRVTQDGVSIGNLLEAHRRGIRVGQLSADQSGISYGGRVLVPGQAMGGGGARGFAQWSPWSPWGPAQPGTTPAREAQLDNANVHDKDHLSSSSSSDSDSESSDGDDIEELLDYDELLDDCENLSAAQYEACSGALHMWLNAPLQHITKADLRDLRRQIRALNSQNRALPQAEKKERKKELKALLKETRGLAKRQKQERRQLRRQEKQKRRGERRERRQQQREVRRARRQHARGRGRFAPPEPPMPPMPPMPPPPVNPFGANPFGQGPLGLSPGFHSPVPPHVPGVPPIPGVPPVPGVPPIPCGPRAGRGGNPCAGRGRPWGPHQRGAHGGSFHRARHESFTRAVNKLEDRLAERTLTLSQLEGEMASNTSSRGWGARRMEGRKHALEKEIEALQSSMEGLQVQADAEYAKLVAEEGEAAGTAGATRR